MTSANSLFAPIPDRFAGDCTDMLIYELTAGAQMAVRQRDNEDMMGNTAKADALDEIAGEIRELINDLIAAHL